MKTSKSSLFLMELIIAILFFALASAVCLQLFTKAHLLGASTINQNNGLLWCQNIAELYLGSIEEHSTESANEYILYLQDQLSLDNTLDASFIVSNEDGFSLYFDKNWHSCSLDDSWYHVDFKNQGYNLDTHLNEAFVKALDKNNTVIYELSLQKYVAERSEILYE